MEKDNGFLKHLWQDLLPFSGRGNQVFRSVLACTLVIILSQTLQIPWLALSLITVFFVCQTNVVVTRLTGILFLIGTTVAVGLSLLILQVTWNIPPLRIFVASTVFLVCVFLMRTSSLYGVVFFVVAIVVIYSQSLVDISSSSEQVVRNILWVCVSINYAICVTLVVNTLLLPAEPAVQLRKAILAQLDSIIQRLLSPSLASENEVSKAGREMQSLYQLLRYTTMQSSEHRQQETLYLSGISTLAEVRALTCYLPERFDSPSDQMAAIAIRNRCLEIRDAISRNKLNTAAPLPLNISTENAVLKSIIRVLNEYFQRTKDIPGTPETKNIPFLVSDAFSNPRYRAFALKTLFSALICYLIYTGTSWPGIHTIMLSCLIVAQPGLGNVQRKIIQRLTGAAIGSLIALLSIVYILPHIETIFGLLMLIIPVLILSAWIANGPESISYAGVQIMFTFSLAVLETFSPVYELTEVRDRLVGIVAGIIVAGIVHTFISPEREGEVLLTRLAGLVKQVKEGLLHPDNIQHRYSSVMTSFAECETLASRVMLEPNWNISEGSHYVVNQRISCLLRRVRSIILLTNELSLLSSQLPEKSKGDAVLLECESLLDGAHKWLCGEMLLPVEVKVIVPKSLPDAFRHSVSSLVDAVDHLYQIVVKD